MPIIKVREGQCLLDIAMQECGDATAAFALAAANGLSVTDDLTIGQAVTVTDVVNEPVKEFFKPDFLKPASANNAIDDVLTNDGIGYWTIEQDFVVS